MPLTEYRRSCDLAKECVLPGQLVGPVERDEPLGAVCIPLAIVRHANKTSSVELEPLVNFILERFAVETLSSVPGTGRITRLDDESRYYSVKDHSVVVAFND